MSGLIDLVFVDPLDIEKVEPIKDGEEDGFESLILPPGHRDIVRALVQTHANPQTTSNSKGPGTLSHRQFDIVKGKGKGLIILLHGVRTRLSPSIKN